MKELVKGDTKLRQNRAWKIVTDGEWSFIKTTEQKCIMSPK